MKRLFVCCLGLLALTVTNYPTSLLAQTSSLTTLNIRNTPTTVPALVVDAPNNNDVLLDCVDDYTIRLGAGLAPDYSIEFEGFTATDAFEVSRLPGRNYIALVRPNGENNNLGHLEAGAYGNISSTAKWIGIGSGPAGIGASVYGLREQWNQNFGIFNLVEVNATTRDLVAWGGTTSNNRLLFNYADSPTGVPQTYMEITSEGRVGIGATPSFLDALRVTGGRLRFGSAESLEDGGVNETTHFGTFRPGTDNIRDLGTINFRWDDVFATNGVIQTSDRRDKTDIEDMTYGLEELMQFRPVTYTWKDRADKGEQLGLIAQEVQEVIPEMVYLPENDMKTDEEGNMVPVGKPGDRMGLNYSLFVPILINGVQEQQGQMDDLRGIIADQQEQIEELKRMVAVGGQKAGASSDVRMPKLYQNNPNPFKEATEIRFYLPETIGQATLYVYDMQGRPALEIAIDARGETSQRIDAGMLESGMYLYALIADGEEVDVKRMILTK